MISVGSVLSLFLWSSNDFKLVRFAMELGKLSNMLSQRAKACSVFNWPNVDGTSVSLFPPIDSTCSLERATEHTHLSFKKQTSLSKLRRLHERTRRRELPRRMFTQVFE